MNNPTTSDPSRDRCDVAVIGSGFGGLATALTLAEAGLRPIVFETVGYPGGCASTFERRGHRFEAGATLFSGFDEGQLMRRWIDRHGLDVRVRPASVELRTAAWRLEVPPSRDEFVGRLSERAIDFATRDRVVAFFAHQRRLADTLWQLFDQPELLPPFGWRQLPRHLTRLPAYTELLPWLGKPLLAFLRRHELHDFEPLRTFLDATCQITVQAGVEEAETLYALAAMDYYFRGTGHVEGGVGVLAQALVQAIRAAGGEVRFFDRVQRLQRRGGDWVVQGRRGSVTARAVAANVLPGTLARLCPDDLPPRSRQRLRQLQARVDDGWGASMLYLVLDDDRASSLPAPAHHLELIGDVEAPLVEGNHLFVSISGRGEKPSRTVTVSTHVPLPRLRSLDRDGQARYVEQVQQQMRGTLRQRAPDLAAMIAVKMSASPRTFERFAGRPGGAVGGIPRRAGWHNYRDLVPRAAAPGLHLVGDSVFPGQSTLAAALGGVKLASRLLRRW